VDEFGNQTEEEFYANGGEVCACCGCLNCTHEVGDEHFDENRIEFLGISEDIMGRDRLAFVCPKCKKDQESYRYG
jgi:hypothetical protein